MLETRRLVLIVSALFFGHVPGQGTASPALALRGYDALALCQGKEVPGKEGIEEVTPRFRYRFSTEENRERFRKDPERWGIQWGGACARMGPLSGRGSADRFTVHDGRIYIFASDGCRKGFLANPSRYVEEPKVSPTFTDEARAAGRRWIDKAVAAHGGAKALDGLAKVTFVARSEQSGWRNEKSFAIEPAGRARIVSSWKPPEPEKPARETSWTIGDPSFTVEDGTRYPLSPAEHRVVLRTVHREPVWLLWARGRNGFDVASLGAGKLGSVPVEQVWVRHQDTESILHLDPESARILGMSWRGQVGGVFRDVVEELGDWEDVQGILVARSHTALVDGKASAELSVAWSDLRTTEAEAEKRD